MTAVSDVSSHAIARARWRPAEIAFWILAASCAFLFPSRYLIMTDIIRLALFTLSLDLILGYAGIVSLGHAAFFGVGAYSAGLLALHGIINEPVIALVAAGLIATVLGFLTSFLVIRGVDLTRLMVTLGIALLLEALAERFSNITGGTDYLYGGLIGAVVFKMLQELFQTITPQYWMFWIGLVLVVIVLVGRERIHRWVLWGPNLLISQVFGRKAVVAVPESDAP